MSAGNGTGRQLRYSMIIEWSDEDNAFIVTVPELSGCRTHGTSYEDAVRKGQEAIETWIGDMPTDIGSAPPPRTFEYWSPIHEQGGITIILSGDDEDYAKPYQEKDVKEALARAREAQGRQP